MGLIHHCKTKGRARQAGQGRQGKGGRAREAGQGRQGRQGMSLRLGGDWEHRATDPQAS